MECFLSAEILTVAPTTSADLARYDSTRVSITVVFQARYFPLFCRMSVTPPGHLPSDLASLVGSFCSRKSNSGQDMPKDII